jgi:RHS repeat-associated protein
VWAGNSGTQPGAGSGTCGSGTLSNSLTGASYNASYLYTNLGQVWQAPQGTSSTNSQYLYCDSSHPHQLTGLYSLGATCSTKTGQTYASSYDAWGNVTSRNVNGTTATLSYDGLDNLTLYNAGSNSQEQYVYDASGNRVLRRSTSSGTTMTVYAFGLEEHLYSGSGVHQVNGDTYYYSLGGMLVGESTGTNTNMFLTDALGSVLETISATANSASVQGNQVYSPYGSSRYQQGSMGTAKGFTGQYNDSVSGLDYYGSRYYDPVVGRFLSADVLDSNLAGMDPYAYVGGNPETFSDPSGQRFAPPPGGGGGGGDKSTPPTDTPPGTGLSNAQQSQLNTSCPYDQSGSELACFASQARTQSFQVVPGGTCGTGGRRETGINIASGSSSFIDSGFGVQIVPSVSLTATTEIGIGSSAGCGEPSGVVPTENSFTFCHSVLACIIGSMGGEEAKGQEESYDTGFGKGGLASDLAGVVGAKCSFTSTTEVTTDRGKQAIGTLQVGERVLAYNPKTGKMEQEPILHVWINHDLVDLTITTTTHGQRGKPATKMSEVIHTNQKHPFFTIEHGFLPVGQIKLGMHLLRADGRVGVVTGWKVVPGVKTMYNLEVAQDHTFTVGTGQWVVHNDCLFRVLRSDEDPAAGLQPKNPNANEEVGRHIRFGSKAWFSSQFISTTNDLAVAAFWSNLTGGSVAVIDSNLVEGTIIDVSTKEALAQQGITWPSSGTAYSYALASREVLIEGSVPSDAILWVLPPPW